LLTCIFKVHLITIDNPQCCDCLQNNVDISFHVLPSYIYRRIKRDFIWGSYRSTSLPLVVIMVRSFSHLWFITQVVTTVTRRMPLLEQELLTLSENLSSQKVFRWVRVVRSLVLCIMLCLSLLALLSFAFWSLCCLSFFECN